MRLQSKEEITSSCHSQQENYQHSDKLELSRSPHTAIFFAPSDARAMLNVFEVLYLAGKEKLSMTTFPSKCGGITRFQMETVAAAYSGAVACKY